jgi:hypothetical protein
LRAPVAALIAISVVVSLAAVGAASGRSSTVSSEQPQAFLTPGPNGASCEIGVAVPFSPKKTWCVVEPPKVKASKAIGATLTPSGRVVVCHGLKCVGNAPEQTRTLRYGHSISVGPFRCKALRRGVHCVVRKLGYGFLLSAHRVTRQ